MALDSNSELTTISAVLNVHLKTADAGKAYIFPVQVDDFVRFPSHRTYMPAVPNTWPKYEDLFRAQELEFDYVQLSSGVTSIKCRPEKLISHRTCRIYMITMTKGSHHISIHWGADQYIDIEYLLIDGKFRPFQVQIFAEFWNALDENAHNSFRECFLYDVRAARLTKLDNDKAQCRRKRSAAEYGIEILQKPAKRARIKVLENEAVELLKAVITANAREEEVLDSDVARLTLLQAQAQT